MDNIVKSLMAVLNSIDDLYNKLFDLELQGFKDGEEYRKHLEYLKLTLEVKDKYYNSLTSVQKLEILIKINNNYSFNNIFNCLINLDKIDRIKARLVSKLSEEINIVDQKTLLNILPKEFIDYFVYKDKGLLRNLIIASTKIESSFQEDLLSIYLSFLKDTMYSNNYSRYLPELLKMKYDLSFINENIENLLLINNFEIKDNVIIQSEVIYNMLGLDDLLFNFLKNGFGIKIFNEQLDNLLMIKDNDYFEDNNKITSLLRTALFRSSFLFINDDVITDFFDQHKVIFNFENSAESNNLSKMIILNTFENAKSDRERHLILKFRKE